MFVLQDLSSVVQRRLTIPPHLLSRSTMKARVAEQAARIARQFDRYENLSNKVTYCLGVLSFGLFCYLLGASPHEIPRIYCLFFIFVLPFRWMYYRIKKWHYYLLDFCYYANAIFVVMLLFFPNDERLFMLCFSFSEGPLAWALIVWRCSLVFSSIDKMISVLIHLLPGTVFFILRWWEASNTSFFRYSLEPIIPNYHTTTWTSTVEDVVVGSRRGAAWPMVENTSTLWTWLFLVPLMVYCIWQVLYFAVVEGIRRQRILHDPQIMTSYRELKRRAERAKNIWWHLSGLLGAEKRVLMYAIIQAAFTIATLALTVPMFQSYRLHMGFEIFKLSMAIWNGGRFVFEVLPEQREAGKEKKNSKKMNRKDPKKLHDQLGAMGSSTSNNNEGASSSSSSSSSAAAAAESLLCAPPPSENIGAVASYSAGRNNYDSDSSQSSTSPAEYSVSKVLIGSMHLGRNIDDNYDYHSRAAMPEAQLLDTTSRDRKADLDLKHYCKVTAASNSTKLSFFSTSTARIVNCR